MQQKFFQFLMLFIGYFSYSQFQFSGQITDNKNVPLAGCDIHLGKNNFMSDANGNFVTKISKLGKQKLFIAYLGYYSIDTTLVITENLFLNFKMKAKSTELSNIVIKTNESQEKNGSQSRKLKIATIEKYSSLSLGDALKEVSGVSTLKAGHNVVKPIINGLHSSRIPIINNNVRLEDQQWGTEHAPNFDMNSAASIEVVKGASGLQYSGDAVGGLVLINPVVVKKDTLFGKSILSLSSNGRGGVFSSSVLKGNEFGWRYNLQNSAKYFGDRTAANYVLSNTGNREINFSGDIAYATKKFDINVFYSIYNANIGILAAAHTGNVNDLNRSINSFVPSVINDFTYNITNPKQQVQHHLAKVNANYYWDERSTLSFQYSYQNNKRLEFDLRRGEFRNVAALDLTLQTHQFLADLKKEGLHWQWKSGGAVVAQNNFADTKATEVFPLIPTYDKFDFGLYSTFNYDFPSGWKVDSGIRYDFSEVKATKFYYKTRWAERGYDVDFSQFIIQEFATQWLTKPRFSFHNFSASVGTEKAFQNNWFVNGTINLTNRNPNPAEFFSDGLHHASGVIELGDLRLQKETALKISVFTQKKGKKFSIGINPFLNSIQNFMFLKPARPGFETTIRGAFPVFEYNQTNALLTGIDIQTDWKINENLSQKLILGYVNGQNVSEKTPLIDMPPFNFSNKLRFEKKQWHDFVFELKHDVVLRQTRFPNYNFTTNIIQNNELVPVIVDISTPPKGYQLMGFYAEVQPKIFRKTVTTIALMGQNILNVQYRDYLNRQRFFADELGRNIQIQLKINY